MHFVTFVPPPTVLYVKQDTPGGDDGASWATAFDDLQSALAVATPSQEVWVAEGTYFPSTDLNPSNSFMLVAGVEIYGGFRGDEVLRSQRNPDPFSNGTVLSGDRLQDGSGLNATDDNSYHVVIGQEVGPETVLDGFTITGGYRAIRENGPDTRGGGTDRPTCGGASPDAWCWGSVLPEMPSLSATRRQTATMSTALSSTRGRRSASSATRRRLSTCTGRFTTNRTAPPTTPQHRRPSGRARV